MSLTGRREVGRGEEGETGRRGRHNQGGGAERGELQASASLFSPSVRPPLSASLRLFFCHPFGVWKKDNAQVRGARKIRKAKEMLSELACNESASWYSLSFLACERCAISESTTSSSTPARRWPPLRRYGRPSKLPPSARHALRPSLTYGRRGGAVKREGAVKTPHRQRRISVRHPTSPRLAAIRNHGEGRAVSPAANVTRTPRSLPTPPLHTQVFSRAHPPFFSHGPRFIRVHAHSHKPVPGEKKTRFPRSTGVRGSRARCSLIEKSVRVPVFFYRLERAYCNQLFQQLIRFLQNASPLPTSAVQPAATIQPCTPALVEQSPPAVPSSTVQPWTHLHSQ
jgi:hypothetical protein